MIPQAVFATYMQKNVLVTPFFSSHNGTMVSAFSRFKQINFPLLYDSVVSLHEVVASRTLQYVAGSFILSYFVVFHDWNNAPHFVVNAVRAGTHICWPYFQSCGDYAFLYAPPLGYSHTAWSGGLLLIALTAAWSLVRGEIRKMHAALTLLWLWHTLTALVFTLDGTGTFDYYLVILGGIFLFAPHKEFFLKLHIVLFYVLSTTTKINEGWILGTYFSSLTLGMPFFPDELIPLLSNTVIVMEMVGAWFLLGKRSYVHRIVLVFFITFHLFSSIFVWYRFPIIVTPLLFVLFGPLYKHERPPLSRRAVAGWVIAVCCVLLQSISILIPGNAALTQEGLRYGMYMFDANHQCVSRAVVYRYDGTSYEMVDKSVSSRMRCDPYVYLSIINRRCDPNIARITWTFDHSINGAPFLRIVDQQNTCMLQYAPFSRNPWILTESDNPKVIGYPLENWYE